MKAYFKVHKSGKMNARKLHFSLALALGLGLTLALLWLLSGGAPMIQAQGPDGYSTYYVAPSCTGVPDPCYTTVQAAVDAADDPDDVIKVATGVYTGVQGRTAPAGYDGPSVITQVVYISKTVMIRGGYTTAFTDPPDPDANPTTLDAQDDARVIFITGDISPTIEGLRITGGDTAGLGGDLNGGDAGGGVYVINATAILRNNQVFSNTAEGLGGGLYLRASAAILSGNTVVANNAGGGGGLALQNLLHEESAATLSGNTVVSNTASGSGGGLFLEFSLATLSGNTVTSNSARFGGGLYLGFSPVTFSGNTVTSNTAIWGGGGLYLRESDATLNGNSVTANTASSQGGGLYLNRSSDATLRSNTIISNTATTDSGGGLFVIWSAPTLVNNLVADNRAGNHGSGLYINASSPRLLHTTIARNSRGDGIGAYVTYNNGPCTVVLTNTILVSHTVGIYVTAGNTVTLEATLWGTDTWANGVDWDGDGDIITGTVNVWGDPAFAAPDAGDYHIGPGSAAVDAGVDAGVYEDIDGDARPLDGDGDGTATCDIGAYELQPPTAGPWYVAPGGIQIIVNGSGHVEGPLPVVFYALTEPTGEDIYPLGEGTYTLYGLYDSGSTKVRINDLNPPNRVAGPNWGKSDTGHLNLTKVETVNLRLNGLNTRSPEGNIPIGPPGSDNEPQVEVRNIAVKPGYKLDVTLIGAPVVNQIVAHIDYTNLIADPAIEYAQTGVRAPYIDFFWPGDAGIPAPDLTLQLEPFGNLVSTDGATPGRRYWLRNLAFQNGDNVVSDQQREFDFFLDTGTTLTIVNDRVAGRLGLPSMSASFDCYGGKKNGYVIDSVTMYGSTGFYRINNASVCWQEGSIKTGDAVIGSNFFDQVQIVLDGPGGLLGIRSIDRVTTTPDTPSPAPREFSVDDPAEGSSPDFRRLTLAYDDTMIYVTILFNSESDVPKASHFVYLYGIHGHLINFNSSSFELRRDAGADGHFEESVYSGSITRPADSSIGIEIPTQYIPDISEKRVWAYSMSSKDRIPNKNAAELLQPESSEEDGPPTVSISVSPSTVKSGQQFTVRVSGTDDQGLQAIWWAGDQTGDNDLDKAHWFDCSGATSCNQTWAVSTKATGTLNLCANSRDTAYPTPGEPHQASEGQGIRCAQVKITPSEETVKCGGMEVGGYCWYFGADSASCDTVCASHGGYHEATRTYAGSDGSPSNCRRVLEALATPLDDFFETAQGGIGCFAIQNTRGNYFGYWDEQPTTASATYGVPGRRRICACQH